MVYYATFVFSIKNNSTMILNFRRFVLAGALGATALFTLSAGKGAAQQQQPLPYVATISRNPVDQTLKSVRFTPDAAFKSTDAANVFATYLGTNGTDNKMVLMHSTVAGPGITADRYLQYLKGIPAEHGNFIVTAKNGIIEYISGSCYKADASLSPIPVLTEADALTKALASVGATKYMWQSATAEARIKALYRKPDTSWYPKGRLVWMEDRKAHDKSRKLHLAYAFNIYATQPLSRQEVYVDATNGNILFSNSLIHHTAASNRSLYSGVVPFVTAHTGGTYILFDSTRGNGVYTLSSNYNTDISTPIDLSSATNVWPAIAADTAGLDVHWGAEKVYDYWLAEHSRHSWDDADGILTSYIHTLDASTGADMDNAYWDGSEMVYGDGTGAASGGLDAVVSLDVTAHEIGHGVCQATANLIYEYEPGAMNEGFSDCWAATIESYADPHESDRVAKSYWLIGEEIRPGSPLRNMANPIPLGDPATYTGTNWYNCTLSACPTPTSSNDQCGVHTNSGVLNHWYYFVVAGGTGTNDLGTTYSVAGIGFTDAAKILYLTENTLASTDDYAACRIASINAAITIFGACSAQEQAVTNAWHAVGVGSAFVPCIPQIGFNQIILNTTEDAGTTACPASHTINIPMRAIGTAITGGTPVVTVVAAGGTAVAGTDYSLGTTSLSF
ncbi:MAG: M4 family peptidase, partial [Chitinophagia bacterium]|nr:M4 family peptidase [Chitinophagia bacterium]